MIIRSLADSCPCTYLHICLKGLSGIRINRSALQLLRADDGVDDALSSEAFRGGHRWVYL